MNIYELKRKAAGHHCPHFGGDSDSDTTTNNIDKRLVTGEGSLGISADNSNVSTVLNTTTTITDGGIVSRGLDTVDRTIELTNATLDSGYQRLFAAGEKLIGTTQQGVLNAYAQAESDKSGTFDSKTTIVLASIAVAGLYFLNQDK